jgi:hypothetical protein
MTGEKKGKKKQEKGLSHEKNNFSFRDFVDSCNQQRPVTES